MICISPRNRKSYLPVNFHVNLFLSSKEGQKHAGRATTRNSQNNIGAFSLYCTHMALIVQTAIDWMPQEKLTRHEQLLSALLLSPCYILLWPHTSLLTHFSSQKHYIQPVLLHLYSVYLFVLSKSLSTTLTFLKTLR